jgi:hypothetical protein
MVGVADGIARDGPQAAIDTATMTWTIQPVAQLGIRQIRVSCRPDRGILEPPDDRHVMNG